MKLSEIYVIANTLAPKCLSDEVCQKYGAYDNSGILIDCGKEIDKILFALDLSITAIEKAIELGAQLIVTHHPAIYAKINSIRVGDLNPLGKKLATCLQNGISVLSMHLNLDVAAGGIDESLQEGILQSVHKMTGAGSSVTQDAPAFWEISQGKYGRVYALGETTLGELVEGMRRTFESERIWAFGDKNKKICKAASFCGAGGGEAEAAFAIANGADVIISSEFKHHVLALCQESGVAVVQMTHYASEYYGFKKYFEKMSRQVGIECFCFREDGLL